MSLRQKIHISADCWEPIQHIPSMELRIKHDFHSRRCIKFPDEGYFLSQIASWHAALLEADVDVFSYIPNPIQFRVGSRIYTPPYFAIRNHKKILIDFASEKTQKTVWYEDLISECKSKGFTFEFISKDLVYEKRQLAENWITITKFIAVNRHHDTDTAEFDIINNHLFSKPIAFGDLISNISPTRSSEYQLALFRLLHAGRIKAELGDHSLNYSTEFELCI